MAAKKASAPRTSKKQSTPSSGRPLAVVFKLADIPFARRVVAAFGLEALAEAPCFVIPKRHAKAFAPMWKTKEPRVEPATEAIGMWLVGELAHAIEHESGVFTEADRGKGASCGYHLGFDASSFDTTLRSLGFEVRGLAHEVVEPAARKASSKKIPAIFTLHDAVEDWTPRQKAAFRDAAREGRVPALLPSAGSERIHRVDRVALLEEIAGDASAVVRSAVLDGIVGEFWMSADIVLLAELGKFASAATHDWQRCHDPLAAVDRAIVDLTGSSLPEALARTTLAEAKTKLRASVAPRAIPFRRGTKKLSDVYGFHWPEELDHIWDFARKREPKSPLRAFAGIDNLGLTLTGPFDVLAGAFAGVTLPASPVLHWRYTFDLPELFTVIVGNVDRDHVLYSFDEELGKPSCVASYFVNDAFEIGIEGRTLVEAIRARIEGAHAGSIEGLHDEPEEASAYLRDLDALASLRDAFDREFELGRPEHGEAYTVRYDARPSRTRATIATPERLGAVVSRESVKDARLIGDGAEPSTILLAARGGATVRKKLVKAASLAADEGFFGDALLVGRTCWAAGDDEGAYALLERAYTGLGREGLRDVLRTHANDRRRPSVSLI